MTRERPPGLFVSDRPVRSDFARTTIAREKSYARRRMATVTILFLVIASAAYAIWGRGPSRPGEIPTIKSEGIYKQKPADPGGIDIPHQDVRVYDELENKSVPPTQVEHLLPPPEVPQEVPHTAAPVTGFSKQMVVPEAPAPQNAPSTPNVSMTPAKVADGEALAFGPSRGKTVETTVTPTTPPSQPLPDISEATEAAPIPASSPVHAIVTGPAPAPPRKPELSIEQVIANTKALASNPAAQTAATISQSSTSASAEVPPSGANNFSPSSKATTVTPSGSSVIQLASSSDQSGAKAMMASLEQKYAGVLEGLTLHLQRADLGSRGTFYRIQSQGIDEKEANRICSALKQKNAGCILVRQ